MHEFSSEGKKTAAEEVQGETADGGRVQKAFEGCMTFPRKEKNGCMNALFFTRISLCGLCL